jgi:hypothetical protein
MTLQDYNSMSASTLVDLLAQETQKFTQLIASKKFNSEYEQTKIIINTIQAAITLKKNEQPVSGAGLSATPTTLQTN